MKPGEDSSQGAAAALHLAVRCATRMYDNYTVVGDANYIYSLANTVALVLKHPGISPNCINPPESGTTALHLAASLGRADIVNLFLETKGVDDTLRDKTGRNCRDVAKGKEVLRAIDGRCIPLLLSTSSHELPDSHSLLNATYRSLLRTYILSPITETPTALIEHLESPRIHNVDLSYLDDASGRSILHEAARRKDLTVIEKAVRGGADIFVRDRKGKTAQEVAGKDDRVKVFLRQCTWHVYAKD